MSFSPEVATLSEAGPEKPHRWNLNGDLTYTGETSVRVPDFFDTDLASTPWFLTWMFPRYGHYTKAAIVHDYLCQTTPDRFEADRQFRLMMANLGVSKVRRSLMWAGVSSVSVLGQVAKRPDLAVLAVIGGILGILFGHPIDRFGWLGGIAVIGAIAIVLAGFIALVTVGRPKTVIGWWALTLAGLPILIVSLPPLVVLLIVRVIENPKALWSDVMARSKSLMSVLAPVAADRIPGTTATAPEPADTPRDRRLHQLVLPDDLRPEPTYDEDS